jgi:hypothetical protein
MGLLPKSSKKHTKKVLVSGQALLVVLLSMSVVLAVVLSSVSKSVTDISITNYEEESLRAFSAAEAGIEEALLESVVPGDTIPETKLDPADAADPRYEAQVGDPEAGKSFEYPDKLNSGEVATFWFVSHDNSGNLVCGTETCTKTKKLEFCWTNEENRRPAVEIAFYYDASGDSFTVNDFSNLKVKRFNFDPKNTPGRNFESAYSSCDIGNQYKYSTGSFFNHLDSKVDGCVNSNSSRCLVAARVRMLDNEDDGQKVVLRVEGGGSNLPSQGILISSTGSVGDSTRKVTVLQGYPEPPEVFEGVLFSGRELSQ